MEEPNLIRHVHFAAQRVMKYRQCQKVVAYRKDTLDLLLSDHRVHCFSCEANGDCKLQDYCFEYGVTETSYPGEMKDMPIDDTNKFFTYDPSLCILCHRCVNTCKEIVEEVPSTLWIVVSSQ